MSPLVIFGAHHGYFAKVPDLGFLPKFSPKYCDSLKRDSIFWRGLPTVLGKYCQIWFLWGSLDGRIAKFGYSVVRVTPTYQQTKPNLYRAGVIPAIPLSGPLFHPLVLLHCGQRDQVGVKQRF